MIAKDIKRFHDLTELEFEFFKDFGDELKNPNSLFQDNPSKDFLDLAGYGRYGSSDFIFLRVIKIEGDRAISFNPNDNDNDNYYYTFENVLGLEKGDFLLVMEGYNIKKKFPVEKSVFQGNFLKDFQILIRKCKFKEDFNLIFDDFKDIEEQTLTKELLTDIINKKIEIQKKEEEKERLEEEQAKKKEKEEQKNKEKKQKQSKEEYLKTGSFELNDFKINGKIIKYGRECYTLDKDVKDVLDYEFISADKDGFRWGNWNDNFNRIEDKLITNKISYIRSGEGNKEKLYEVKFFERGAEVNGVKMSKARVKFILNRIENDEISKEEIKILSKISEIKYKFLNLNAIETRGIKMGIEVTYVDGNNFKIKILEKEAVLDWNFLKELFSKINQDKNDKDFKAELNENQFLSLINRVGIEKQELLDVFKRKTMVKKLKENNQE